MQYLIFTLCTFSSILSGSNVVEENIKFLEKKYSELTEESKKFDKSPNKNDNKQGRKRRLTFDVTNDLMRQNSVDLRAVIVENRISSLKKSLQTQSFDETSFRPYSEMVLKKIKKLIKEAIKIKKEHLQKEKLRLEAKREEKNVKVKNWIKDLKEILVKGMDRRITISIDVRTYFSDQEEIRNKLIQSIYDVDQSIEDIEAIKTQYLDVLEKVQPELSFQMKNFESVRNDIIKFFKEDTLKQKKLFEEKSENMDEESMKSHAVILLQVGRIHSNDWGWELLDMGLPKFDFNYVQSAYNTHRSKEKAFGRLDDIEKNLIKKNNNNPKYLKIVSLPSSEKLEKIFSTQKELMNSDHEPFDKNFDIYASLKKLFCQRPGLKEGCSPEVYDML